MVGLLKKPKNGWGLYKVRLKSIDGNLIESPTSNLQFIYYSAIIFYEKKIMTKKKKDKVDIKYYRENSEKCIDNTFLMSIFGNNIKLNTEDIKIELTPKIDEDSRLDLGNNKELDYLEERTLSEDKDYYVLMKFSKNKPIKNSIIISDDINNFKNDFYFKISLISFPFILSLFTYIAL